jgi:hypothetical protein
VGAQAYFSCIHPSYIYTLFKIEELESSILREIELRSRRQIDAFILKRTLPKGTNKIVREI